MLNLEKRRAVAIESKCGGRYTPFASFSFVAWPVITIIQDVKLSWNDGRAALLPDLDYTGAGAAGANASREINKTPRHVYTKTYLSWHSFRIVGFFV